MFNTKPMEINKLSPGEAPAPAQQQAPKTLLSLAHTGYVLGVSSFLGAVVHNVVRKIAQTQALTCTDADVTDVLGAIKEMAQSTANASDELVATLAVLSLVPTAFLTYEALSKLAPLEKSEAPINAETARLIQKLDIERRLNLLKVEMNEKIGDQIVSQVKNLARGPPRSPVRPSSSESASKIRKLSAAKAPSFGSRAPVSLDPPGTPETSDLARSAGTAGTAEVYRPSCLASPVERPLALSSMDSNKVLGNPKWKPFAQVFVPNSPGSAGKDAEKDVNKDPLSRADASQPAHEAEEEAENQEIPEITLEHVYERLIEGELNNFRRLFIPGKGWIAAKRLMQEYGITQEDLNERIAAAAKMANGPPVLKKASVSTFNGNMLRKSPWNAKPETKAPAPVLNGNVPRKNPWNVNPVAKAAISHTKAKLVGTDSDVPWGLSPETPFGPALSGQPAQREAQKQFHPRASGMLHPAPKTAVGPPAFKRATRVAEFGARVSEFRARSNRLEKPPKTKHGVDHAEPSSSRYQRPTTISVEQVCMGDPFE